MVRKRYVLAQVQESTDQVYADFEFEYVDDPEGNESGTVSSPAAVKTKIDKFLQAKASDHGAEGEVSDSFKSLAEEFSVAEKTPSAIDANLLDIVKSLLTEKVAKEKYWRPEDCTNLVAPKINKQNWQQSQQETRNNDSPISKGTVFAVVRIISCPPDV